MPDTVSDAELVELLWQRQEQALLLLRQKYERPCRRLAASLLADTEDVGECLNDAYFTLWELVPPQRPQSLAAYLLRIVRNLALKRWEQASAQKRSPEVLLSLSELEDFAPALADTVSPEADPVAELERKQLLAAIAGFLHSQPLVSRRLFMLRYWYFQPLSQIGAQLGLSPNAAAARLARLRAKLKIHLQKEGFNI